MALPQVEFVSEAEFLALPESMEHVELLDGEVIVSPAPTFGHQEVLGRLVTALRVWAGGCSEPVTVGQSPLDVRFAPNRILQPDAFVILAAIPRSHTGPIERVPDLCVEVTSSDRAYDRVTKRLVYAAAGVREYWVIHPSGPGLFERFTGPALETREVLNEPVRSALLPGFSMDLGELFAD